MNIKKSKLDRKLKIDLVSKSVIFLIALSGIAILLLLFAMILKEAFPAYGHYGFFHMYFTADFSEKGGWGIWGALSVTLITSIVAILIALPIALRASFFIRFRMKKGKKIVRTIINILAGVPSVVFGIFALNSLTGFTGIFGMTSPASVFVGIVTLIIMIFPTLVSMISNQLDLVSQDLINASLALGNTNTHSLYKVVKKSIRQGVYVSAIVALGRAIGETMALSMILQVTPEINPLAGGLNHFLNSSGGSLGVMIARNMFSDSSDPYHRSALFAAGISLFIVVMVLIAFMIKLSKTKTMRSENPFNFASTLRKDKYPLISLYYISYAITIVLLPFKIIEYVIILFLEKLKIAWGYFAHIIEWPINKVLFPKQKGSKQEFFIATSKHIPYRIPDVIRLILEVASLTIIFGSIFWIVIDVFRIGLPNWSQKDWSWSYYQYTSFGLVEKPGVIANTMVFTLVLVILSIIIALPFALATAIYLSEYATNKKSGKTIRFFLDSLGGTPSILFGLFGVVFFRQVLGLGNGGFSLMAGALTMVIVIIPTFTRSIEQVLVKIPMELRMASYSLGASKFETIRKVIVPLALPGMTTGIILSAGRVIAETAPVYLTIGMLGSIHLDVNGEGWTMTTKILYNQIFSTDSAAAMLKESYAIASAAFILITGLILLTEAINPMIKHRPITRFIIRPIKKNIFKKGVINV